MGLSATGGAVPRWADAREKAALWDGMYAQGHLPWDLPYASQELVATVLALDLVGGQCALDLGCGAGSDVLFLAALGLRVTGLDLSQAALAITGRRLIHAGLSAELVQADALALPFPSSSFDFISDRGCYHHITTAERPRYAAEIARVLKPGGSLLLRGCAIPDQMWVQVDESELVRLFDEASFEKVRALPFRYDARVPIDAMMALIRKRTDGSPPRG